MSSRCIHANRDRIFSPGSATVLEHWVGEASRHGYSQARAKAIAAVSATYDAKRFVRFVEALDAPSSEDSPSYLTTP